MSQSVVSIGESPVLSVPLSFSVALNDAYTAFNLKGDDVAGFLQRRTSNDVLALAVGQGHLNSFLRKTAGIQCLFQLWRIAEDEFIALVESPLAHVFEEEAQRFKLMETFVTARVQAPLTLAVYSSEEDALAQKAGFNHEVEVLLAPTLLLGESAVCGVLILGKVSPSDVLNTDSRQLEYSEFASIQLVLGVLRFESDYTHETKLPETTLERYAVSYTKGCYLGQETVAKVKTYGGLKHTMVGVLLDATSSPLPMPEVGQPVYALINPEAGHPEPPKVIGRWGRSTSLEGGFTYACALLERAYRAPGQRIECQMANGQTRLGTVGLLPHQRLGSSIKGEQQERQWHREYEAAMQQFVEGELEQAIQQMRSLTLQAPTFWQAHEGLGVLLGRAERYPEAMKVLTALITENPNWPMAYTNLSIYALKLGDKDAAEHWKAEGTRIAMKLKFDAAMAAKQANQQSDAEAEKVRMAREAQLRERVELFKQALQFAPTDALAHYGMATALQELHAFDEAVKAYQTTIEHHPTHTQAYLGWAECLVASGKQGAAIEVAKQGIVVASQRGDLQPLTKLQAILNKTRR
jgi:folate-binding protein YgfZ